MSRRAGVLTAQAGMGTTSLKNLPGAFTEQHVEHCVLFKGFPIKKKDLIPSSQNT